MSKAYHCLVLMLSMGSVAVCAAKMSLCTDSSSLPGDSCTRWPATDVAVTLGAVVAIGTCGGLRNYFKSAQMQIQITEHLKQSISLAGLEGHLRRQKITDGLVMVSCPCICTCICACMCLCLCSCLCIRVCTCMCLCFSTCTHATIYIYMYIQYPPPKIYQIQCCSRHCWPFSPP